MAYQPLTLDKFKTLLRSGQYSSPTGARRAVGKASAFSAADKASALKLIDGAFASEAPKAAKAPKAPKAAKKAASKIVVNGEVQGKKRGPKPKVKTAEDFAEVVKEAQRDPIVPVGSLEQDALHVGERVIVAGNSAATLAIQYATAGVSKGAEEMGEEAISLIQRGIKLIGGYVDSELAARAPKEKISRVKTAKESKTDSSLNGASTEGKSVFDEASPS